MDRPPQAGAPGAAHERKLSPQLSGCGQRLWPGRARGHPPGTRAHRAGRACAWAAPLLSPPAERGPLRAESPRAPSERSERGGRPGAAPEDPAGNPHRARTERAPLPRQCACAERAGRGLAALSREGRGGGRGGARLHVPAGRPGRAARGLGAGAAAPGAPGTPGPGWAPDRPGVPQVPPRGVGRALGERWVRCPGLSAGQRPAGLPLPGAGRGVPCRAGVLRERCRSLGRSGSGPARPGRAQGQRRRARARPGPEVTPAGPRWGHGARAPGAPAALPGLTGGPERGGRAGERSGAGGLEVRSEKQAAVLSLLFDVFTARCPLGSGGAGARAQERGRRAGPGIARVAAKRESFPPRTALELLGNERRGWPECCRLAGKD